MAIPESVRLKIERAKEHYYLFKRELRSQFHGHSGKIAMDANELSDFNITIDAEISKRIPLILGDCLSNLRSSLDYLVWELVLAAKNQPGKINAFPICSCPKLFKEANRRGRLDGLTDEMKTEIKLLQPYQGGDYRQRPLWLMEELNNIHKHRRFLLIKLRAAWAGKVIGTERYAIAPGPFDEMYTDIQPTAFIGFDEGSIMSGTPEISSILSQLISEVERLIPNFEHFF